MKRTLTALALVMGLAASLPGCTPDGGLLYTPKHMTPVAPRTLALMEDKGMDKNAPILMRVYKADAKLEIWKKARSGKYALLKTYDICRWSGDLGPKVREGDRQAPEGFYTITPRLMNPNSSYYLSFDTGFPNAYDRVHGRSGNNLMVHGDCSSRGCYAMTNEAVEEIYAIARDAFSGGQKGFQLHLMPFHMSADNLYRYRRNQNISFWQNLKEGSDHFEVTGDEPVVAVCAGRYVFNQQPFDPGARFEPSGACPPAAIPGAIQAAVAARQKQEAPLLAGIFDKTEKKSLMATLLPDGDPAEKYDSRDSVLRALPSASPEALSLLPGVEAGPTPALRRLAQVSQAPSAVIKPDDQLVANVKPYDTGKTATAEKPAADTDVSPDSVVRRKTIAPKNNATITLRGIQD